MSGAVEYTRDAVGFGQESGVGDGKTNTDAEALDAADDWTGFGEDYERLQIADDEASEQHEAQLTTGRLDDGRLEVLEERHHDHAGGGDTEDRQDGRDDGEGTVPAHVLLNEPATAASVVGRPPTAGTRPARGLIFDVRVRLTRNTDPTAGVALLDSFDVSDVTRLTAL